MSSQQHQPRDHEQRIATALEDIRPELEELADTDTPFAARAESALEWLEDHLEEDDAE